MLYSINPSDPKNRINPKDLESLKEVASSKTKMTKEKPVNNSDEVVLSSLAKDIQIVKSHLEDMSLERLNKLKDLETKIAQGQYHVSAQDIAKKIIESTNS
ncbi:MAG: flagellar biosynthesis anti-sigma factor FlgM [Elusimicrobiota bacterium]